MDANKQKKVYLTTHPVIKFLDLPKDLPDEALPTPTLTNQISISLDKDSTPAIAVFPEWTLWATLSFRVIDSFFVRTAYDGLDHNSTPGAPFLQKGVDTERCVVSLAQVRAISGTPSFHGRNVFGVIFHTGYNDFRGGCVVWSIKGDAYNRISTEPSFHPFPYAISGSFLFQVQHNVRTIPALSDVQ